MLGLVPAPGEAVDVVNRLWYGAEGDMVNAGLSCAAMVPLAGLGATATKWGIKYGDEVVALSDYGVVKIPEAMDAANTGCSFSGDTLVSTPEGDKEIAELRVGDTVLAWDEETGETGGDLVTVTFSHGEKMSWLLPPLYSQGQTTRR